MATAQQSAHGAVGKIRLEVVTPTGSALQELVDEFTAPSVQGEFGVLPGHLPLLAALRTGLVSYRKGSESLACAVGPGFVEVADDQAVLLTDRFATKDSIDVVRTRLALKEVQEKLGAFSGEPGSHEQQELIAEEQWQAALLTLYGDPPAPTQRPLDPIMLPPEQKDQPEDEPLESDKAY